MTTRTWAPADSEVVAAYCHALLTSPSSLLPGLSAIEAEAAMAYMGTLPMSRNRSVVETWQALSESVRAERVAQSRARVEGRLLGALS